MIDVTVKMKDSATAGVLTLATASYPSDSIDQAKIESSFTKIEGFTVFFVEIRTERSFVQLPICGLAFAEKFGRGIEAFIDIGRRRQSQQRLHSIAHASPKAPAENQAIQ